VAIFFDLCPLQSEHPANLIEVDSEAVAVRDGDRGSVIPPGDQRIRGAVSPGYVKLLTPQFYWGQYAGWIKSTPAGKADMTDRTDTVQNADTAPQAPSRDAMGRVPGWRRAALAGMFGITAVVALGGWICLLGWLAFTLAAWIVA
jgi:hypothetical protein